MEGSVGCDQVLMTNEESSELAEPGIGAFDDPAARVASEFSAILVTPVFAVLAIRNDEVDATFLESLTQRIGVVSTVGDYPLRLLPGAAFGLWDFDFGERGFGIRIPATSGRLPYCFDSGLTRQLRPAAKRANITKEIGWHTFRRSLATLLTSKKRGD
jgi:hypothetical protein